MENVANNESKANTVRVVSKDGCKYCVRAKDLLKAQNIPFEVEKLGKSVSRFHSASPEGDLLCA